MGEVKKIAKQKHKKTYDFRIDQAKILLETTSLSVTLTALPTTVNDDWILSKLQSAVDHIKEKDTPLLPDFFRGGLIVYETVFNFLTKFHLKLNGRLASLTGFLNDSLDFLAFAPQPASIDNISSLDQFPIVFYVKEGQLAELFRTVFKEKNYTIIIVW